MEALHRNINHWVLTALIGLGSMSHSSSARADSLRCDDRIVSTGDTRYEVRASCGEPDDIAQRVEYRTVGGRCWREGERVVCDRKHERVIEVVIDEWLYDFGRNRFIEHITFEQGYLVSIRTGSYGHKAPR
jgi:hypothetical protein